MTIVNLTQHTASEAQRADGVTDLEGDRRAELIALLTFDALPTPAEVERRATEIASLAKSAGAECAMVGCALWLVAPLSRALLERGIQPRFAFSRRVSEEVTLPDGSVKKTQVFVHEGWVDALA